MENNSYAVDLHIHSALSPCADEDMTPNNIVHMCKIKELDVISITDHNTTANLPAFDKLCKEHDILFLPGIEVNTKEEVHLLCYFENLDFAMKFGDIIYQHLPDVENNEKIFGTQLVLDENDRFITKIPKLLISAVKLTVEEVVQIARSHKGQVVPAHVDKPSYSLINNLGFIPKGLGFKTLEVSKVENSKFLLKASQEVNYNVIQSSDAHYLEQILERNQYIKCSNLSAKEILAYL